MILWTASAPGSDNSFGVSPLFAPMKIKSLNSIVRNNKRRGLVALSFVGLILLALVPGAAQLRNPKRVIALRLGEAAEGSRVSIVADGALNDYEAFRRGDRFYVKIALADFTSLPHLRADGFDDVQVQRVGDDLIVSFKLQPGATARVDQGSNRLDVVFSSPNRVLRTRAPDVGSNRVGTASSSSRAARDRGPDGAGPMPPGSELAFRQRVVTDSSPHANEGQASRSPRTQINPQTTSNRDPNRSKQATGAHNAVKTPSPFPSPSSVLTPATSSSYPALTTASPSAPINSNQAATSAGSLNWEGRRRAALAWISANRLATLLGALILLSLILYLAMALGRRRKNAASVKRANVPKVQPRVQPNLQPADSAHADFDEVTSSSSVTSAASQNYAGVLTKPSITSPTALRDEPGGEEEEREVFEL